MARALAEVAYRVIGMVALLFAVRMLPDAIMIFSPDSVYPPDWKVNRPLVIVATFVPFAMLVIAGLLLIGSSARLASRYHGAIDDTEARPVVAEIHTMLLSTVGLLLIGLALWALPGVFRNLAILFSAAASEFPADQLRQLRSTWGWLAGVVLQLAFGLFLVMKGSTLVTLLRRRYDRAPLIAADARCPHCGFWYDTTQYRTGAASYRCGNCKAELSRDAIAKPVGSG